MPPPMGFEWWWIRYPWVDTHGCVISPPRGYVLCHPYRVLCYYFIYRGLHARCAFHPRLYYVTPKGFYVMPPRRGSNGGGYVIRGLTPTAVLYHRYAVLCYVTPTGFIWWLRYPWVDTHGCVISPLCGSVLYHRYAVRPPLRGSVLYHPYGVRLPLNTIHRQLNDASNKRNFKEVI